MVITGDPVLAKRTLLEGIGQTRFSVCSRSSPGDYPGTSLPKRRRPPLGKYTRLHPPHAFPLRGILRTAPKTGICSFLRPGYPRHPRLRTPHPSIPISRTPTCRSRFPLQSAGIHSSPLARDLRNRFRTQTNLPRSRRNLRCYARHLPTT